MVSVKLHGIFERYVKTDWLLNVKTVYEVFEAIEANSGNFVRALGYFQDYLSHFVIYVDEKPVPAEYLNSPILNKNSKIEVVPIILSADFGLSFFLGLLLLAASVGIQFLITSLMTPKAPKDIKNNSRLFSGYENVTKRNVPIPIGYGRLKIGSILIANDITFINKITT
jgi:predicted phage tail protein